MNNKSEKRARIRQSVQTPHKKISYLLEPYSALEFEYFKFDFILNKSLFSSFIQLKFRSKTIENIFSFNNQTFYIANRLISLGIL